MENVFTRFPVRSPQPLRPVDSYLIRFRLITFGLPKALGETNTIKKSILEAHCVALTRSGSNQKDKNNLKKESL